MVRSIIQDVKQEFNQGNMVTRIIIVNLAIFVFINVIKILLFLSNGGITPESYFTFRNFFCISSDWKHNLTHPWVIITSMFLHEGFWHILWNMLFLYWFGRIVGDFIGNQRILPLYLLGGITGGVIYFFSANLLPFGGGGIGYALGASAAVMAIVVASGVISPDYIMRLLFLGDVKLKYIVAVLVFLDLIGVAGNYNTGGHFAHLGGAFFGWLFVFQLRNGNDWSVPVNKFFNQISSYFQNLFSRKSNHPKVIYKNPKLKKKWHQRYSGHSTSDKENTSHQERLDAILEKIKQSGYESLTEEEKAFLFDASKK